MLRKNRMNKHLSTLLGLSLFTAGMTPANDAHAEPPPSRRVVGLTLSSTQAVLLDEETGEYRIVRIGDEVNGGRVVAIGAEDVVLVHGGTKELLSLAADSRPRPKTLEPMVISMKPMNVVPPVAVAAAPVAPVTAPAVSAPVVAVAPAVLAPPVSTPTVSVPTATATASVSGAPPVIATGPVNATATAASPAPVAASAAPATTSTTLIATPGAPEQTLPPGAPKIVFVQPLIPPPEQAAAPVAVPAAIVAPPALMPEQAPSTMAVPRVELDRGLGDFRALDASVALEIAAGGFRVADLRAGSFLERMGLRRGDVIQRVDGRALRSAEDASAAYNWVRVTDHFAVDLVRNGRPITLRFQITA